MTGGIGTGKRIIFFGQEQTRNEKQNQKS